MSETISNKAAMAQIFKAFEKAVSDARPPQEGDYIGGDGLLYCGKCNTPKQCRITIFDEVRTPYCMCACEKEAAKREDEANAKEAEVRRIRELRQTGFPDSEMQNWTFEKDDGANEKLSTVARRYVDNFDEMYQRKKGLLLYGSVGTGKTFIAACIANALIDRGYKCMVTNFARLVNIISGRDDKQEYLDGLNSFDLLVIDDLAAERDTEYMQEIVTNIIDARYRSGKPLIVTTNLTKDELSNPAETRRKRIFSRLFEMTIPIAVNGADRRKDRLRQDYNDMQKLLGLGG